MELAKMYKLRIGQVHDIGVLLEWAKSINLFSEFSELRYDHLIVFIQLKNKQKIRLHVLQSHQSKFRSSLQWNN